MCREMFSTCTGSRWSRTVFSVNFPQAWFILMENISVVMAHYRGQYKLRSVRGFACYVLESFLKNVSYF